MPTYILKSESIVSLEITRFKVNLNRDILKEFVQTYLK